MCSSMTIKSLQGDIFWGRTMDYNTSFFHESPAGGVPGKIVSLPANQTLPAQTATWKTKYAAVGVGVDQSVANFLSSGLFLFLTAVTKIFTLARVS